MACPIPPDPDPDRHPGNNDQTPDDQDPLAGLQGRRQSPGPVPVPARRRRRTRRTGIAASTADSPATGDWEISELVAAGVLDAVPGDPPVPLSVWRAGDPDPDSLLDGGLETATAGSGPLTTRLAGMLLAVWTDPGELVIDTLPDPAVRAAADSEARTYLPLQLPLPTPQRQDLAASAALILLRWPQAPAPAPARSTDQSAGASTDAPSEPRGESTVPALSGLVMSSCRDLLLPDGHTVVILIPPSEAPYRDYAREVIAAAREAGLGYLQHLVIITSDTPPPRPEADELAHPRSHVDLLVLVIRRKPASTTAAGPA